jgi:hypothetical protein
MKALTISQPHASLIASGENWVVNCRRPMDYRGPLAIHAGKETQYLDRGELAAYPTGCVVAVAKLVACVDPYLVRRHDLFARDHLRLNGIDIDAFLAHDHTEGPWCLVLQDAHKLREPIHCRGAQRLWDWQEPELVEYED